MPEIDLSGIPKELDLSGIPADNSIDLSGIPADTSGGVDLSGIPSRNLTAEDIPEIVNQIRQAVVAPPQMGEFTQEQINQTTPPAPGPMQAAVGAVSQQIGSVAPNLPGPEMLQQAGRMVYNPEDPLGVKSMAELGQAARLKGSGIEISSEQQKALEDFTVENFKGIVLYPAAITGAAQAVGWYIANKTLPGAVRSAREAVAKGLRANGVPAEQAYRMADEGMTQAVAKAQAAGAADPGIPEFVALRKAAERGFGPKKGPPNVPATAEPATASAPDANIQALSARLDQPIPKFEETQPVESAKPKVQSDLREEELARRSETAAQALQERPTAPVEGWRQEPVAGGGTSLESPSGYRVFVPEGQDPQRAAAAIREIERAEYGESQIPETTLAKVKKSEAKARYEQVGEVEKKKREALLSAASKKYEEMRVTDGEDAARKYYDEQDAASFIEFSKARQKAEEEYRKLEAIGWEPETSAEVVKKQELTSRWEPEDYMHGARYVFEKGGERVGDSLFSVQKLPEGRNTFPDFPELMGKKVGYSGLVGVEDKFKGQGLGSEIVKKLEAEAKKQGAEYFAFMDVISSAKPFYEKMGYSISKNGKMAVKRISGTPPPSSTAPAKTAPKSEPTVRLYRVEAKDLGDKGEWLKKHITPEQYESFIKERGRLFTDDPKAIEKYGYGLDTHNSYYIDVPASEAAKMGRKHPDGFTEFLVPQELVDKKQAVTFKKDSATPAKVAAKAPLTPIEEAIKSFDFPADSQVNKNLRLYHVVDLFKKMEGGVPEVVKTFRRKGGVLGTASNQGKIKLRAALGLNENIAALVMTHELSHVADAIYGDTTRTYARGNILGRIGAMDRYVYDNLAATLKTKEEMTAAQPDVKAIREPFLETVRKEADAQNLKGKVRAQFVRTRLRELSDPKLREAGFVSQAAVSKELTELARWWNQDKNMKPTGVELYAEGMSVYLLSPKDVAKRAPIFYDLTKNWLQKKPEFEMLAKEFWALLEKSPEVGLGKLYNTLIDDAHQGEVATEKVEQEAIEGSHIVGRWQQAQMLYDFTLPLTDQMISMGLTRADQPFSAIQKSNHSSVVQEAYATDVRDTVYVPLNKSKNLTLDMLHVYAFTERIRSGNYETDADGNITVKIGDRSMKLNSRGVTPQSAAEMQEQILKPRAGDEWDLLKKIHKDMIGNHIPVLEMYGEGPLGKELNDQLKDATNYVPFMPNQYIDKAASGNVGASKQIYASVGHLGPVGNTVLALVKKDLSLISTLLRSTARQRFVEWATALNNGTVKQAKRMPGGHFDSAGDNYETIYWLWGGKVQAAHVHKDFSPILNRDLGALDQFMSKASTLLIPFKYAYVNLRAAFFFVNILRDARNSYMNLPDYKFFDASRATSGVGLLRAFGIADAFARSFQELPAMLRHQMGKETDAAVQEMKKAGVGASHFADELAQSAAGMEKLLRQRGVFLPDAKYKNVTDKIFGMIGFAVDVVNASDMATKVANYKLLKARHPDMSEAWIADVVNTRVGTPDTTNKGLLTSTYNFLFMYSHVAAKGWQGSYRSFKEAPKSYALKMMMGPMASRLFIIALGAGLIGRDDEEKQKYKRIMAGIPEYFKATSNVIPLGITEGGKSVFLTLPLSEAERVVAGITYYTIKNMNKDSRQSLLEGMGKSFVSGMDYAQTEVPGLNPLLLVAKQAGAMWDLPKGEGPIGGFGQPIVPARIRGESGKTRAMKYWGHDLWNNTAGLGQFYRFSDSPEEIKGTVEKITSIPLIGDVLRRFLRVSNAGLSSAPYEAKAEVEAERATVSNDRIDAMLEFRKDFISDKGSEPTKRDVIGFYRQFKASNPEAMRGVSVAEFYRSYTNYSVGAKGGAAKALSAFKSGSSEAKAAALKEVQKSMSPGEFRGFTEQARKDRLISPAVMREFRRRP